MPVHSNFKCFLFLHFENLAFQFQGSSNMKSWTQHEYSKTVCSNAIYQIWEKTENQGYNGKTIIYPQMPNSSSFPSRLLVVSSIAARQIDSYPHQPQPQPQPPPGFRVLLRLRAVAAGILQRRLPRALAPSRTRSSMSFCARWIRTHWPAPPRPTPTTGVTSLNPFPSRLILSTYFFSSSAIFFALLLGAIYSSLSNTLQHYKVVWVRNVWVRVCVEIHWYWRGAIWLSEVWAPLLESGWSTWLVDLFFPELGQSNKQFGGRGGKQINLWQLYAHKIGCGVPLCLLKNNSKVCHHQRHFTPCCYPISKVSTWLGSLT